MKEFLVAFLFFSLVILFLWFSLHFARYKEKKSCHNCTCSGEHCENESS